MAGQPEGRSGVERAAILLLTLGEQDAAQVLRHLGAKDVQRVGAAMAHLSALTRDEVTDVLGDFNGDVDRQTSIGVGTDDYIRKVMVEALGADKANGVIDRILRGRSNRGLEALKWMEPRAVADILRFEHPQIVAIVLSYLDSDQSAVVLSALPENMRPDIVTRIALLDGVHPAALKELDQVLEKQFTGNAGGKSSGFGGPKAAAEIMNLIGTANEGKIFEEIKKADEALVTKLQELMFVFDDLAEADDRGMQELLREVPGDKLVVALKAASQPLRDKFFKNMSERASQMLKDDLEAKGPVKLSEVETVQKEIILIARRLSDEGKLQLSGKGGGGDEYV